MVVNRVSGSKRARVEKSGEKVMIAVDVRMAIGGESQRVGPATENAFVCFIQENAFFFIFGKHKVYWCLTIRAGFGGECHHEV